MIIHTLGQIMGAMLVYCFLMIFLPSLVLRKKLENFGLVGRVLVYLTVGNFYIMNLVFALQLLHICNWFTMFLGTVIPVVVFWIRLNQIDYKGNLARATSDLRRVSKGYLGRKTAVIRGGKQIYKIVVRPAKSFWEAQKQNWLQWICFIALIVTFYVIYGNQVLENFGYMVSDLPVHNYWINEMSNNNIFAAGVYPFGYHCVIYYLHTMFGFDTFVLLRVFGMVQGLFIHLALFAFLKAICKSKMIPYATTFLFLVFDGYVFNTYYRYATALPQEYGMLFILPAIYFLYRYFEDRKQKQYAKLTLMCFAMNVAMTLSVHFYDTIILGLFCIAVAIGYCFWVFRWKHLWRIVVAGVLGILIAILPMGIAFATGTPFQGSIGWGIGVLTGEISDDPIEMPEETEIEFEEDLTEMETEAGELIGGFEGEGSTEGGMGGLEGSEGLYSPEEMESEMVEEPEEEPEEPKVSKLEIIKQYSGTYLLQEEYRGYISYLGIFMIVLVVVAVAMLFFKEFSYAGALLSTAAFMALMFCLQAAKGLGLPALMNGERTSMYFAYVLPLMLGFAVDGVVHLVSGWWKSKRIRGVVSIVVSLTMLVGISSLGMKKPLEMQALEMNEAMICLTNIIEQEQDYTWTIVSTTDELQMLKGHGYHYELVYLMYRMEGAGAQTTIEIPTRSVYFFVEKAPLDYYGQYDGSGQLISKEGAEHDLPNAPGNQIYWTKNRWILMSRFYYWAEEYRKIHPNEMRVYYETDDFICYRLTQNTYRLFNLAIDYNYNVDK